MTDSNTEAVTKDERELFEQALRDMKFPVLPVWKDGSPYQNYALEVMWKAWMARAAATVQLPELGLIGYIEHAEIAKLAAEEFGNTAESHVRLWHATNPPSRALIPVYADTKEASK